MQYKTIVLHLLEQHPQTDQLRRERKLLSTMERHATELQSSHEAWKERLLKTKPESEPSQIASEALELAVEEMRKRLCSATPHPEEIEPLSLDAAMAYIRKQTPTE